MERIVDNLNPGETWNVARPALTADVVFVSVSFCLLWVPWSMLQNNQYVSLPSLTHQESFSTLIGAHEYLL